MVTQFVKRPKRLQNIPPVSNLVNIPIRARLLAEEACGVVGIPPADRTDEEQQHTQHTNNKRGASCCIYYLLRK